MTEPGIAELRVPTASFGQRNWAIFWERWRAVAEFSVSDWTPNINVPPPDLSPAAVDNEIKALIRLAIDERPDARGELMSQHAEILSYFMALVGMKPDSHQASYRMLMMVDAIAVMLVMHFKGVHDRASMSPL